MAKLKGPAFKSVTGEVVLTGSVHDTNVLPENFEIMEEGYVTEDNKFVTREQVKEALNKALPTPTFPNLGLGDNRRETAMLAPKHDVKIREQQVKMKQGLMDNALKLKYAENPDKAAQAIKISRPVKVQGGITAGKTVSGGTPVNVSYSLPEAGVGTQLHEDTHMMFKRVHDKFGSKARSTLAHNLYNAIPEKQRNSLRDFVSSKYKGGSPSNHLWHEEHLANLITYLNHPKVREVYHKGTEGHWDPKLNALTEKGREFQSHMKGAYRAIQDAAKKVDTHWLKRVKKTHEFGKSENWSPTEFENDLALEMLHSFHTDMPEFKAAKFMANQYEPTQEEIDNATSTYEGDHYAIALAAHGLPVNEDNVELLRKIMGIQEMSKSEIDIAAIPRIVKPFNYEAIAVADMVRDAFENATIKPIKLNGKHSSGTAILKNPLADELWLLKPGSGKLSPAMGVREEQANQSRREVAFNTIAKVIGLGKYVPKSALVVLDGQEVAALQFFSSGFKPIEKLRKDPNIKLDEIFKKFVGNGLIYKWAAMDYLLGQSDRHFGNIMMDDGDNIRFIDAGSAFAGRSFNPGKDPKSFIPCYLRAFTTRKFKTLTPVEKNKFMPTLDTEADQALGFWIQNIDEGQIVKILNEYGINPDPVIERLYKMRGYLGSKSEFLRKFYSNLL